MKSKDIQELKLKPDAELARLIEEGSDALRVLRFDLAAGKVKDISKIREAKKKIARMQTFLREREMAEGQIAKGKGRMAKGKEEPTIK